MARPYDSLFASTQRRRGIDLDGAPYGNLVQEGLKQPFLFILGDQRGELAAPASRQIHADFESIYDRLPSWRLFITIREANQCSFRDQMLVKNPYVFGLMRALGVGGLDGRPGLAITVNYVHTPFYLKDAPAVSLGKASQLYPQVQDIAPASRTPPRRPAGQIIAFTVSWKRVSACRRPPGCQVAQTSEKCAWRRCARSRAN